jgi:hypothetical protein
MIIHVKKSYRVNVELTREELKKRGFRFCIFKNDPQRFGIYLTRQGETMYANAAEALMAIVIAYDKVPRKRKGRDHDK